MQTTQMLLRCGAAVNAFDTARNTPLHIIVSNKWPCDESFVSLLCDAGAHLDFRNTLGKTPADLATVNNTRQFLRSKMNMNLKCLCARLIRRENVPLNEKLGSSLVAFVQKH